MRWKTKIVLICLVLLATFLWAEVARSPKGNDGVRLYFLDVGQGDAELIQKGDYQILIDGGPDDKVLSELGKVMPLTDRKIEIMILSHPHADHLAGLNQVLSRYKVDKVYLSGVAHTSDGYLQFLQKIKDENINVSVPIIGESITPYENAKLTFLWPGNQYQEQTVDNLNNVSIVNQFCYFDSCALYTGDIETDEQAKMFEYYKQLGADPVKIFSSTILKIPHHGSSNGSNELLYKMITPSYFVIEVGAENKYGHPHQQTLDLAVRYMAKVLRTDRDGTVEFVMGKEGVSLSPL